MPIYEEKIKVNGQKRWFIRTYITDENGKCKQITKHNKEWLGRDGYWLAQQEENKLKYNRGTSDCNNITLDDLFERYFEYINKNLKPSSIQKNLSNYNLHIKPKLGKKKVAEISTKDILVFHVYLDEKAKEYNYKQAHNEKKNNHLSLAFKKSIHVTLSTILNFGCKYYNLEKNVASIVGNFKTPKGSKKKIMNYLTQEEFDSFIKTENNEIYKDFFTILFYTGLRRGELLALTRSDIDFKTNEININKSLNIKNGKEPTIPKTNKANRKIKMLQIVKQTLEKYKDKKNFLWEKINISTLKYKCDTDCIKANVKKNIRIHDFRHSFASMCINKNVPIEIISEYLGHENISTTLNIYSHLYPNSQDKLISILEKQDQKQDQHFSNAL